MVLRASADKEKEDLDGLWGTGTRAQHWLGIPLLSHKGHCLGALVIQSYDEKHLYSDEDQKLFALFSTAVANAIG